MSRSQTGKVVRRSSSVPAGPRHTSNVAACLNHSPRPLLRNHAKDNKLAVKAKERDVKLKAKQEEAAQKVPAFKLKQFKNVPSRIQSRPSSAPARRSDVDNSFLSNASSKHSHRASTCSNENSIHSQGWRVASGYKTLSSPPQALATPPATPPRRIVRSPQVRACSTPVKPSRCRSSSRDRSSRKTGSPCDGGVAYGLDEEVGLDVAKFDQVAKNLREMQCRRTPTKDGQGLSTQSQPRGSSMYGLLSHDEADKSEIPAGYRLAPEEERLETLQQLQKKHHDLCDQYDRLPLRSEYDAIHNEGPRLRQQLLLNKIAETERAVQVFSRSKVFVEV